MGKQRCIYPACPECMLLICEKDEDEDEGIEEDSEPSELRELTDKEIEYHIAQNMGENYR